VPGLGWPFGPFGSTPLHYQFDRFLVDWDRSPDRELIRSWPEILLAVAAVLLGRVLCVYGMIPIANRFAEKISLRWQHVLVWGGLHGSLSLALVLSLDSGFPDRGRILVLTFGVVAFSIIVQGLTIKPSSEFCESPSGRGRVCSGACEQIAISDARAELEDLLRTHAVSHIVYEYCAGSRKQAAAREHGNRRGLFERVVPEGSGNAHGTNAASGRREKFIEQAVHDGLITPQAAAKIWIRRIVNSTSCEPKAEAIQILGEATSASPFPWAVRNLRHLLQSRIVRGIRVGSRRNQSSNGDSPCDLRPQCSYFGLHVAAHFAVVQAQASRIVKFGWAARAEKIGEQTPHLFERSLVDLFSSHHHRQQT